jgi:hypothetical protein
LTKKSSSSGRGDFQTTKGENLLQKCPNIDAMMRSNQDKTDTLSFCARDVGAMYGGYQPSCCKPVMLSKSFPHCLKPLLVQYGYDLSPIIPSVSSNAVNSKMSEGGDNDSNERARSDSLLTSTSLWKLYEDRNDKPGLIIDYFSNHHHQQTQDTSISTPESVITTEVVFKVPLSNDGIITITFLKSYDVIMGKVLVWLDTLSPTNAKHLKILDGWWEYNVSLSETFTWQPNRPFIKNVGYRYFSYYKEGFHDLHVRLITSRDYHIKYEGNVITSDRSRDPTRSKFKLLGITSC